jgi:hypothetical protein
MAPLLECHEASKHHLFEFGFFLDTIKPWFLTEGKFSTVLIIPSSWGSQLDSEITSPPCHINRHHQVNPNTTLKKM